MSLTDIESRSKSTDLYEDETFLKFNTLSGWKSLLLLQFQMQTALAVICGLYLSYVLTLTQVAFALGTQLENVPPTVSGGYTSLIYAFDLFYFIDLISMIIFKNVKWSTITLNYKARHGCILFAEFLSVIPIDIVYHNMTKPNMRTFYVLRLRYVLRLSRLFDLYKLSKEYVGVNSHILHFIVYLGVLIIISLTIGCVAYVSKCSDSEDIMCSFQDYKELAASWYSSTTVFTAIGVTDINEFRKSIVKNIVFSFISFILNAYFISYFTCDIIHLLKPKFVYINICTRIKLNIELWKKRVSEWRNYHRKIENLFDEYEYIYWERNKGVKPTQFVGQVIPLIMYKEVILDISWVPLKHSHLFRHEDVDFLRLLSTVMMHKFFFPGELIYKRNEYKTRMVYIISGIAEILSEEDGETPIMSLSSGTCLGEASLHLTYRSTCSVVSKNVCNVAIIERKDFMSVSDLYPAKYRRTLGEITARCSEAKRYQEIARYQFSGNQFQERISILTMKWLKLTLRSLLFNVRKLGDLYSRHYLQKLEQNVFCTKYLDLLVIAEDVDLTSDSVFIKNTFPFIFKERSVLLNMWNTAVLITTVCLAATYPYFAVFISRPLLSYTIFHMVVTFMWFVDVYLRISTAVKTKYLSYVKLSDLLLYNMTKATFLFDLLGAVPVELFVYLIDCQLTERARLICQSNRLLKLYKIGEFFQRVRVSTSHHVILKYTKFTIYMLFLYYYIAAVLYLLGCDSVRTCTAEYENFERVYKIKRELNKLAMSLFTVFQFSYNLRVTKFPFFTTDKSYIVLMFLQFSLLVFNVYFISYISAAETLNKQDAHTMEEFSRNISITMKCFNLNANLQERIWTYVQLQFEYGGIHFLDGHTLFDHLPNDLFVISKNIHLGDHIRNVPLFHDLDEKTISQVCTIVSVHLFPPNEVFKRTGEVCSEIHIIMEGSCSMVTWTGETATLEPGDCFSILESFLQRPSLITVTTLTQCKVISIDCMKIIAITLRNPVLYEQMNSTIVDCKSAIYPTRTTPFEKIEQVRKRHSHANIKSFGYRLKRRTKPYNEYHDGFPNWFIFKYILMRYTFYCNGTFVYYWEISRCVFAFTANIIFPMSCVSGITHDGWYYARLCTDVAAYCDIYFRHHVSYFNRKGLEVTHPFKTARYYWKHGLLVDFLASFHMEIYATTYIVEVCHLFQLYRLNAVLKNYTQKISAKEASTMIKYIPYVLLFNNLVGSLVFRYYCTVTGATVTCKNGTWVSLMHNETRPFETYVYTIFFTTSGLISTCYGFIDIANETDMFIFAACAVCGYVIYNYLVAKTIASNLAINYDLISYQEAMRNLVNFMSYKRIDKRLRTELINHFEFMWNKTNGKSIHKSFAPFKTSFKVDALYNIYGMKFEKSTIFPCPNRSFFKSLLLDVKHEVYLKTGVVYRVNDIGGIIYILFKGQVEVIGADKNRLLTLHVGSVFGNLDNCPMGRRTLTMVASGHVEVLAVSSSVFHTHLKQFPRLNNHFRKLTIFNVDFLEEIKWQPELEATIAIRARSSVAFTNLYKRENRCRMRIYDRNKYINVWETIVIGAVSCASYLFGIYHVATNENATFFYLILYTLDLLYVIKIYLAFHTSYEDDFGNVISSRRDIAKRYIKTKLGFYFDIFTVVPFELATLFCINHSNCHSIWALSRLNRLVRIVNVIVYLRSMTQKLNINVFIIRTLYLLLKVILSQATLGCCVIIILATSDKQWSTNKGFSEFMHGMRMITNTSAKLSIEANLVTFNTFVALCLIFAGLFSRIIAIVYMAESCAILFVTNRTKYIYERFIIFAKTWMDSENVSPPLADRQFSYMKLLWTYNKGVQFPSLLEETPYYLKEALLNSMFGFHFRKHPIMKNCHVDLIRQMTSKLKTLVLFPGDIVVYVGDIDHCMYFIQEGEVQAISEDTMYSEVVEFTLKSGDMFGFDQGIYYRCGHDYTYKVSMYSILVYLKRDDWIYLLSFFPASKSLVYDKAKEI